MSADHVAAPPRARRRRRLMSLAAGGVAALVLALVLALTLGGSGTAPPATGAASLVPAGALAYVNLSVDPARPPVRRALQVARGFPGYPIATAGVLSWVGSLLGVPGPVDYVRDLRPWLGHEAALAVLDTTTSTAGSLVVLDVSNRARARAFLTRSGVKAAGAYRGAQLLRARSGLELAFTGHYLALGQDAGVRAALDVAAGSAPSLQHDPGYIRASAGEPAGRVLDVYASAAGVQRVLASRGGVVGALGTLLYQPALQGVTMSLSPVSGGMEVQVHTTFDRTLLRLRGTPAAPFSPSLQNVIPAGSALMFDLAGLDRQASKVLAAGAAAGIASGVGPLLSRLGSALSAEGVNVPAVTSLFHGETAVALARDQNGSPALTIVARTAHEAQTRAALAALEVPLAQLFPAPAAGPGGTAEFNDHVIDGITAHELALAPGLQLDYAVFHGLVVVSTSLAGIASVIGRRSALGAENEYRSALPSGPKRVSSLLFLDLRQLLSLGEQMGLTHSARLQALMPDLDRIRAVGMDSTSGEADSTAELYLQIP